MVDAAGQYAFVSRFHRNVPDKKLIDCNRGEIGREFNPVRQDNIYAHGATGKKPARFFIEKRSTIAVFEINQTIIDIETPDVPAPGVDQ